MIVPARTDMERQILVQYLANKMGCTPRDVVGEGMPYEALAVWQRGKPMGAFLYRDRRRYTISLSWAGEPGWLTRRDLRELFTYPFLQMDMLLVTGTVDARNTKSIGLTERVGFERIGEIPHAFGYGLPALMYGLERDKCRWLAPKEELDVEQRTLAA